MLALTDKAVEAVKILVESSDEADEMSGLRRQLRAGRSLRGCVPEWVTEGPYDEG